MCGISIHVIVTGSSSSYSNNSVRIAVFNWSWIMTLGLCVFNSKQDTARAADGPTSHKVPMSGESGFS